MPFIATVQMDGATRGKQAFPLDAGILFDGKILGDHSGDLSLADAEASTFKLDHVVGRSAAVHASRSFSNVPPSDFESHIRPDAYPKQGEIRELGFRLGNSQASWASPSIAIFNEHGKRPHVLYRTRDAKRCFWSLPIRINARGLASGNVR